MLWHKFFYHRRSIQLGFTIPPNTFGKGLAIHHYGCIVVNDNARIGENCIIQQCVNIGQNYSEDNVPMIGDNVYIGCGAKIIGGVKVGNNVRIGANCVVVTDIPDNATVVLSAPRVIVQEENRNNVFVKYNTEGR